MMRVPDPIHDPASDPVEVIRLWRGKATAWLGWASLVLLIAVAALLPDRPLWAEAAHGAAQRSVTVVTETIEYVEYDYAGYDYADDPAGYAAGPRAFGDYGPSSPVLASYGPFHVVAPDRAEMIGDVDSYTPGEFRAMLADFPRLREISILDCGGTVDDNANLRLARMIRRAGIATHVPANGSVRSGGVELFLAGVRRTAEPGAEFVVHSWRNALGLEAADYPEDDPAHAPYLAFYREVGMAPGEARAFYALTNSAPNAGMRQLSLAELSHFGLLN
jgi:hypothetical protein